MRRLCVVSLTHPLPRCFGYGLTLILPNPNDHAFIGVHPPSAPTPPNLWSATGDAVAQRPAAEKRSKTCKGEDFSSMSEADLRGLRTRWRGLAHRKAVEEDQKFQVLVAAILSSRAQAAPVSLSRFVDWPSV